MPERIAKQKDARRMGSTHKCPKAIEIYPDCTTSSDSEGEIDLDRKGQQWPSRIVWVAAEGYYLVTISDNGTGKRLFPNLNTFLVCQGQAVLTEDAVNSGTFYIKLERLDDGCPSGGGSRGTPPIRVQ
jgi:hypothetical protein